MNVKRLIWILPIAGLLLSACTSEKGKKGQGNQVQYKTLTVQRSDQTLTSEYSARLTGLQIVEIRPQVSGNITRICINEGQQVTRGQALFIIDQVPYQAALEVAKASVATAQAKMETARMEYESSQTLKSQQVVSDYTVQTSLNALNEAKAALAQAKAQELNARNNWGYTVVKSPVNGSASAVTSASRWLRWLTTMRCMHTSPSQRTIPSISFNSMAASNSSSSRLLRWS